MIFILLLNISIRLEPPQQWLFRHEIASETATAAMIMA
jgi:hypothetical protein